MEDGVVVTGVGAVSAAPDVVHVALGVEARSATVSESLAMAVDRLGRVRAALGAGGVSDFDVVSTDTNLWSEVGASGAAVCHTALGLAVVCRDITSAGRVVADAVAAGGSASRLHGMRFVHSNPAALLREARERAWSDAAAKAEHLAALAGRRLEAVTHVREVGGPGGQGGDGATRPAAALGGPPALPLEGGGASVAVALEVRWELGEHVG